MTIVLFPGFDVELFVINKRPTRLAESLMFSFQTPPRSNYTWFISKIGRLLNPHDVMLNGSQGQHGELFHKNAVERRLFHNAQ